MLAYVRNLGNGLVFIHPLSPVDPGYGQPGGGVDPGFGIPTFPHPGHGLPRPPHFPDNSLPDHPPPTPPAGKYLVMVRNPDGKWRYAFVDAPPPALPEPAPKA